MYFSLSHFAHAIGKRMIPPSLARWSNTGGLSVCSSFELAIGAVIGISNSGKEERSHEEEEEMKNLGSLAYGIFENQSA